MKLKLYLTISYVKYIVLMLIGFLLIIWLAQIIRYLDLSETLSIEFNKIGLITSYLLPNALSAILPIIVFISSCFYNKHINQTNEVSIASLYLSKKNLKKIVLLLYAVIVLMYVFNTEIISVNAYNKYKNQEIEFRNQFKIKDIGNQIYVKDKINLFYESKNKDSTLEDVTTYLIEENVVINSEKVNYEQSDKELIFTFIKGERISSSDVEKSFTNFDKLKYNITNTNNNQISLDKENYNFIQLIKHKNKFFNKAAHRKIIDLLFLILVLNISGKIIFLNEKSSNLIRKYSFNLFLILVCFTSLTLITKLFISDRIALNFFYITSIITILIFNIILKKKYAFL